MRAIWSEEQNVADPGVLVTLAEGCGLEGHGLLEAADAEAVRAEYRGNTERALAAGVFGSPFYAFAGELEVVGPALLYPALELKRLRTRRNAAGFEVPVGRILRAGHFVPKNCVRWPRP